MNRPLHNWNLSPSEAVALQQQLRARVVREDRLGAVRHVAGTDVGFERSGSGTRAAVAVLRLPGLELVDQALAHQPTRFPYVPGLLSFREAPAVLAAFGRLRVRPDLILCDGQGIAHPRRMGIASHIGLWLDIPAVGVGKTRLTGVYAEPAQQRGAWTPLTDGDEILGAALRTRPYTRPLFISTGHRISLETAVKYVMACITRYRLPETTRWSHRLASATPPSRKRA